MADYTIYTRTYSRSSAGRLVSGKRPRGEPLSSTALLDEFRSHAVQGGKYPTALVSVSNRVIDTVTRAYSKYYMERESPADIWIVFIKVPAATHPLPYCIHAALPLAEACKHPKAGAFRHEFVFEWAIPEQFVVHQVSLQTLMDRGLDWEEYIAQCDTTSEHLPTRDIRDAIARDLHPADPSAGPCDLGIYLGLFAKTFGARAPLDWIAHQLFHDCVWTRVVREHEMILKYAHGPTETVYADFFRQMNAGIETVLRDWWLADIDFFLDCEGFKEWRAVMEDIMVDDLAELYEARNGPAEMYVKMRMEVSAKHEKIRADIEAEAVRIGYEFPKDMALPSSS
ncbi:hypothetical protein BR93DRAFT_42202 [Coniochaeta sp. PMI_546]|nr:hypothetical protein BR93DRAFT_42202 [Coniochaeta sp. PMI_546]